MKSGLRAVLGALAVAAGVFIVGIPEVPDVDSQSYLLLAEGRMNEVVAPYASRVLHPAVVRWVREAARLCGGEGRPALDWAQAFGGVAGLSLLAAFWALAALNRSLAAPAALALLVSPLLCLYTVNIYLQDLFALALLAVLLVLLQAERFICALAVLFLLHLTRESAYVVTAVLVAVSLVRRQWLLAAGACLAAAGAAGVLSVVTRQALPNIHAMNGFVYLATKVVANGLANVSGITVWSDSYARLLPHYYPDPPLWKVPVAAWLPLGRITEVGVYDIDCGRPLELLRCLLSTFGVMPLVALREAKALLRRRTLDLPLAQAVAGASGLLFLLLSPFCGRSIERIVGYAWPLFWFAVPSLWAEQRGRAEAAPSSRRLWMAHLACMWWPALMARAGLGGAAENALAFAGIGACYWSVWRWERLLPRS